MVSARSVLVSMILVANVSLPQTVFAQTTLEQQTGTGVATPLEVRNAQEGMIVCAGNGMYIPCETAFSSNMVGVVTLKPAISFKGDNPDSVPVLSTGKTSILVNNRSGEIKKGDFITSSTEDGVGEKATKSGYVVGSALEDAPSPDESGHSLVPASVSVRPIVLSSTVGRNLIQLISEGLDATYLSPLAALRYVVSALIAIFSVVLGLLFFGRIARSGIWAMSRNPSAGRSIQLSILFNVVLSLFVMGTGILIAYVILAI